MNTDRYWLCAHCSQAVVKAHKQNDSALLGTCPHCRADNVITPGRKAYTDSAAYQDGQQRLAARYQRENTNAS